jgi:hypothetical protein
MDQTTHALKDRLSTIYGAVVPSDEKLDSKVVDYKNPEKPGRLAQFLASRTFPASYRVFLVNESHHDISRIELSTGGFDGTGDELVELNRLTKNSGPLRRGESLLLEELDFGMLDFVLPYHLSLTFSDGGQVEGSFSIDKAYSLRPERYRLSKALKTEAYHFPLEATDCS